MRNNKGGSQATIRTATNDFHGHLDMPHCSLAVTTTYIQVVTYLQVLIYGTSLVRRAFCCNWHHRPCIKHLFVGPIKQPVFLFHGQTDGCCTTTKRNPMLLQWTK